MIVVRVLDNTYKKNASIFHFLQMEQASTRKLRLIVLKTDLNNTVKTECTLSD